MKKGVFKIKIGLKVNRLEIISFSHQDNRRKTYWNCKCDCGNSICVNTSDILSSHTKSCGCLKAESVGNSKRTHGKSKTPEYKVWCDIIKRTENSNHVYYSYYGGRGIKVCERWRNSFEAFLSDMGVRPSVKYSIERKNNDQGYNPENCIWIDLINQSKNKRNNINIKYNGEVKILQEWANYFGLTRSKFKTVIKNNSKFKIIEKCQ